MIIGEWAIAIGNPFGFLLEDTHPSVTVGVISALHRSIKTGGGTEGVYKDMIQTDAAINPGNSGGPLVNSLGDVIGINTFIISGSGGSMGVGFAIPVNRVKHIVDEVAQYGHIRQIWIGFLLQEMTPLLARSLGLEDTRGVIVTQVVKDSPADAAGIKRGDVIIEVNNEPVRNIESAQKAIFGAEVGDRLDFKVLRQGKEKKLAVTVEELPAK
jgi:serine protease Do